MFRQIVIPGLAICGVALAVNTTMKLNQPVIPAQPVAAPAQAPYTTFVAGAGIVEASTENIAIGTAVGGLVTQVGVTVGQRVQAGQMLFTIDDRSLQADLRVNEAAITTARARLERLRAAPRAEEIPPAEARVREAEANVQGLQERLAMWDAVEDRRAVSAEDYTSRKSALATAEAQLAEARASLALLRAGTFGPEIAVAEAELTAAMAARDQTKAELERLTVRAPVDCTVLQLNVRLGEYAATGALSKPLIVVGNTERLRIRVDVDENDAWRIEKGRAATAFVRGNARLKTDLTYVRTEPLVVPKKSLTGESSERVDTRVLQVMYEFDPANIPVYVGQLMDVYIDAPSAAEAVTASPSPSPSPQAPTAEPEKKSSN